MIAQLCKALADRGLTDAELCRLADASRFQHRHGDAKQIEIQFAADDHREARWILWRSGNIRTDDADTLSPAGPGLPGTSASTTAASNKSRFQREQNDK